MMRANKRDSYFTIQQRHLSAKMTDCVSLRLVCGITEMFYHYIRQVECRYQLAPRLFPDLHRVADVIGMTMGDQDQIDVCQPDNLLLHVLKKRIGEPRIH